MRIIFSEHAWEDYLSWERNEADWKEPDLGGATAEELTVRDTMQVDQRGSTTVLGCLDSGVDGTLDDL